MAVIGFDKAAFYAAFPAFQQRPVDELQQFWNAATGYVDNTIYGCTDVSKQTQYLNLMTAHLAAISDMIRSGQTPGMVTGSQIDKISVTLQPPPEKNQFQWWLNLTPYGMQLLSLLQMNAAGGFYVGGRSEISAFRRSGGF